MKARVCIVLLALPLVAAFRCAGAEALVNGGLEEFTYDHPEGWTVDDPGTLILSSGTHTSPFTSVYPLSTRSVYFPANPLPGFLELSQNFSPFSAPYVFSFDFMLEGPATGMPWMITLGGLSNPDFYLAIDNGMFRVSEGESFGTTPHAVTSLTPLTWYHVSVQVDPGAFRYGGSITAFGGGSASWEGLGMHRYDGDTRNLMLDSPGEVTIPIYFDNFSIVPVPEPATTALLLVGFGSALVVLRRGRGR